MKKLPFFIFASVLSCLSVKAQSSLENQNVKFGYLAVERVLVLMPEMEAIQSELKGFESQLLSQVNAKVETFQSKLAEYQKVAESLTETDRLEKERELESLEANIQKFRVQAQQAVTEKEARMLQPVYSRIQTAIDSVARTNEFSQIFRAETLLYNSNAIDIFDLMVSHLHLKAPKDPADQNN